jgi:hypothetical protein
MKKFIYVISILFVLTFFTASYLQAQTEVKQKSRTGMSHRKKGALIGAGAGAATGAVISRNRSKGAIIGGAVGAGAGYMRGRRKDKQDPTPKQVTKTKTVTE